MGMALMAMSTFEMLHAIGMQAGPERHLFESTKRAFIAMVLGESIATWFLSKLC